MYIEHIAMYVNDLEKTRQFFETYFEAQSNDLYHNLKTGINVNIRMYIFDHLRMYTQSTLPSLHSNL